MGLREELIQVAAVAVAIVQDLDLGTTHLEAPGGDGLWEGDPLRRVLSDVEEERVRQEQKWGPQHHSPEEWLAILAEEVGEAAREVWTQGTITPRIVYHLDWAERHARKFLKGRFGPDPS